MIEPLQAVLIRMLLNEIKKYVYSNFFFKISFLFFFFCQKQSVVNIFAIIYSIIWP